MNNHSQELSTNGKLFTNMNHGPPSWTHRQHHRTVVGDDAGAPRKAGSDAQIMKKAAQHRSRVGRLMTI